MRIRGIVAVILMNVTFSTAQDVYRENLWASLFVKKSITRVTALSVDAGYRSCDRFLHRDRNAFGRLIVERNVRKDHSLGIGFALFGHFNGSWTLENRPFVQYSYQKRTESLLVGGRFRNEFRLTDGWRELRNRTRMQVLIRYTGIKEYFQPGVSVEGFISTGDTYFIEQRYTGFVFSSYSRKWGSQFFYTLQRQSGVDINQHIIGIQLQLNLE